MTISSMLFQFLLFGLGIVFSYKYYGKYALFAWIAFATILANIEASANPSIIFGYPIWQGNVLFGLTFLLTDIAGENHGKKFASKVANTGIFMSFCAMIIFCLWYAMFNNADVSWLNLINKIGYDPRNNIDLSLFITSGVRVILVSFLVFWFVQKLDVYLFHKIWDFTASKFGKHKMLWLRNNGATFISQIVNAFLFTYGAYYVIGENPLSLLPQIIATLAITLVVALMDTPLVYLARKFKNNK